MTDQAPSIPIRLARREDIPALERLVSLSIRGLAPGHYEAAAIESSLHHLYGVDTQLIEDGTYYLAAAAAMVVACGGWSARMTPFGGDHAAGRDGGRRVPGRDPAVIRAFYVDPGWARRGLGRRLIEACEGAAKAAGFDRFELTSTRMGIPLYAAAGYREVHPVDITLPDGIVLPHVLMAKP